MSFNRYVVNVMDDRFPNRSIVCMSSNERSQVENKIQEILNDAELSSHVYIVVCDINDQKVIYRSNDGWLDKGN